MVWWMYFRQVEPVTPPQRPSSPRTDAPETASPVLAACVTTRSASSARCSCPRRAGQSPARSDRSQSFEEPHEDEDQCGVLVAHFNVHLVAVIADGKAAVVECAAEIEPLLFATGRERGVAARRNGHGDARRYEKGAVSSASSRSPLTDSNRRPPPYHGGFGLLLYGH
jgi:hypothetical protein